MRRFVALLTATIKYLKQPSDGRRSPAFDAVCDIERPLEDITNLAHALQLMCGADGEDVPFQPLSAVATVIKERAAIAEKLRGNLFHQTHPHRGLIAK